MSRPDYAKVVTPIRGSTGDGVPDDKRNFQAWLDPVPFDQLDTWFKEHGISRVAFLEAFAEWTIWYDEHRDEIAQHPAIGWIIMRAREITAGRLSRRPKE